MALLAAENVKCILSVLYIIVVLMTYLQCFDAVDWAHSLANRDSCPTLAKREGIEYLQTWTHRN